MELIAIAVTAFLASGLTLFSGFGLGTLLMPVFALFFPVPVAIAATALVHLANNLFKLVLLGRRADPRVVLRFGLPAALAALAGAALLGLLGDMPALARYTWAGVTRAVEPVKAVVGTLIIVFAVLELSPRVAALALPERFLVPGGLLSGFFGGLSGNQGALRAAFLLRAGLDKEAFVATGVVCAVMVDAARLAVYGQTLTASQGILGDSATHAPVLVAMAAAFSGAWVGRRLLKKVTLRAVQLVVACCMIVIGAGLAAGLI